MLFAAAGGCDPTRVQTSPQALLGPLGHVTEHRSTATAQRAPGRLAVDLLECLGRRNPHWAGNVNVFIGEHSVERHLAQALRVYPGCRNLALFFVGNGSDAYSFKLQGSPLAQYASLVQVANGSLVAHGVSSGDRILAHQWLETASRMLIMVVIDLPREHKNGALDIHVLQRSSGRSAIVEFSLDADAAGPGCYAI
jgi:hypothetical protein